MRIEILLKNIRKEKRIQFRTISKINRDIKFTFELYREKRVDFKEEYKVLVRIAQVLNVKVEELYRVIPQHKLSAIFLFHKRKKTFHKISTIVDKRRITLHLKLKKIKEKMY